MDGEVLRGRWSEEDPLPPEDWIGFLPARQDADDLYRREAGRLVRFFRQRVPRDEARDFVHDTFRKWLGAARTSRQVVRAEAYLTTIAVNLVRDRERTDRRHAIAMAGCDDEGEARTADPHENYEARDMLARVDAAIATLKPKTREIFLLHRIDGLDYAGIAERMEMSVKGVEWQIGHALDQIRRKVGRR